MQTTTNYNLRKAEGTDKTKKYLTEDLGFNFDTIDTALANKMNSSTVITDFWKGSQAEYDELETHSTTTLYLIEEE